MTWERGQRMVPGVVIPPPATERPKPPPPPGGWPQDGAATPDDLAQQVIGDHTAAYHPGRRCRENDLGKCAERFREVPMLAYDLPLRPDLLVRLTLPRDVTPEEAERLCGIIRALPLKPDPEIWVSMENIRDAKKP